MGFSTVGTVLTLVGVYGVIALSVASRRREIAIRSAIGASARHIQMLIVGEGLRLVGAGIGAGIVLALVVSRVLQSFLFEVEPTDPVTLATSGLLRVGDTRRVLGADAGVRPPSIRWTRCAANDRARGG